MSTHIYRGAGVEAPSLTNLAATDTDYNDDKMIDTKEGGRVTVGEVKAAEEAMMAESEFTEHDYKKLKRKVDFILLPLMWWCYGIQQTDKTGLGTMNLYGVQADTGMVGNQYAMLTVVFYVAYALFEFPSNFILQRYNMGKCLTIYMFCWGIIVLAQAFLTNWSQFMGLRFLQGAFECTISPGFNLIIANWYLQREHNARSLVFQSANAGWGVVVDLTMYGIAQEADKHPGGFAAWRGISAFLGGQTLVAAGIAWFMLGTPNEVRWLSKREKLIATSRVMANHAGTDLTGRKTWKWSQVCEAFGDPVLYFQFVNCFLSCIVNGSLTTFGSVVMKSFGFTESQVILYSIPRNVVSVLWFVCVGFMTLRLKKVRMWIMMFSTLPPFIGLLVIALLPTDTAYRWIKWGGYLMTVTFVIPTFSAWSLIGSNTAGRTKRSIISSTTFIAYCTGNIAGSQVMQAKDAPYYIPGTIVMSVAMAAECLTILAWRFWLVYCNKKKAEEVAAMGLTTEEAERRGQELGADDVTDRRNPFFTYTL
jgi:MFS family permease